MPDYVSYLDDFKTMMTQRDLGYVFLKRERGKIGNEYVRVDMRR